MIAAAPMRQRRRGGVWVAGGGARAIGDNQGAVSRCKAHFPSCVQNNSQAMTVADVLATMVEDRVSRARRERDHSHRRSQPTPSSCVGLPGSTTEPEEPTMKEPMSGQNTAGTLLCPRCRAAQMTEVTSIAPLLHEPGLVAYECPRCGHLTSIVQPPADPRRR